MKSLKVALFSLAGAFGLAGTAYAPEAYVLPYDTFWGTEHHGFDFHAFDALKDPGNLGLTALIVVCVLTGLILNFFFRRSTMGKRFHTWLESFAPYGKHFVRITIAGALFFSAASGDLLGPELHGSLMPFAAIVRYALYAISIMIALGFLTELAALAGIAIFLMGWATYGSYIFTYLNYLGELIVLSLFGLRSLSLDKSIFGPLKRFKDMEKYRTLIIRIFYGLALIYAAITVKLLHPALTIDVVNDWHLTQFHWLFPSDPLLVTLGAGIVEAVIGLFIIFGFEMRLTVLVSLFYITLSLLYFRELVWPHLLLYGISFSLLVEPETFTIDNLLYGNKEEIREPKPA